MIRAGVIFLSSFLAIHPSSAQEGRAPLWPNAEEIERFLKEADITEREEVGQGITKPEKVTLELDGRIRQAIFKKVDRSYDSWRFEVGAYELDKLLGLGMVPPTVERSIRGRKGCLQLWVTGTTMNDFEGELPDPEAWRQQVSMMWLFDDLIANIDRHLNNAMVSPEHRLILIDNSKTFRHYRDLLNDLNGAGTGTHARFWCVPYDKDRVRYPTRYPADFIERLRNLTEKQIKKTVGRYVHGYGKDLVVKRWEIILDRLTKMEGTALVHDP